MFNMWRATRVVAHKSGLPRRTVLKVFIDAWLKVHGVWVWNPDHDDEALRRITIALGMDWTEAKAELGLAEEVTT